MKQKFYIYLTAVLDIVAAFVAWILFYFIRKRILGEAFHFEWMSLLLNAGVIGVFWSVVYSLSGSYSNLFNKGRIPEVLRLFNVTLLGVVILFFTLLLDDEGVQSYKEYYRTFFAYLGIHYFFIGLCKLITLSYIKENVRQGKVYFNTLLIGSGSRAASVVDFIQRKKEDYGYRLVGVIPISHPTHPSLEPLRLLQSDIDVPTFIRRAKIQQVILALEPETSHTMEHFMGQLQGLEVTTSIIPENYHIILGSVKVKHLFELPFLEISQDLIPVWQKALKRSIDILLSLSVLVLGLPFLVLVGLLTKLTSKGPIFYRQERIGRGGKPFYIIKFRSMYINSESQGPALASDTDKRITPWGKLMRKTRLDEFPQFYNVLKGDMSLVGPRPERAYFIEQIVQRAPYYRHLHKVRPGITSLGQVRFGYAENVDEMVERLKYDILYIENMSLSLDIEIMLDTVVIMIQGRGK
ncbi:MAG: sugar transferase [Cytophagaceae bacterium]|nr:sugar transferase [Cytophagaceae bacterium]